MRAITRRAIAIHLALATCLGLAETAIAQTSAPDAKNGALRKVTLVLNYVASGPHAGFTYAKKLGYYAAAGLDVNIVEGRGSANTSQFIGSGNAEFGYSDTGSAMQVRAKGGQLTIIAPIVQNNTSAIISLKASNIKTVSDLVGKKVAIQPGSSQTSLLDAIFKVNHIDKDKINLANISTTAFIGSLMQGQVDAILGGADAEAVQLGARGADVSELFYRDIGVPTVGLALVANDAFLKDNPDVARKFVDASLRGWAAARENPEKAAESITEQFPTGADTKQSLAQLNIDLKFMCAEGAVSLGKAPAAAWDRTFALLTAYAGLPAEPAAKTYFSEDYLPANPPACQVKK